MSDALHRVVRLPTQLQLAQLVDEPPHGDDWLHEQKFDGYRILAELDGRKLRLLSRRFNDWTAQFPTVVDAVSALPVQSVLLDGEELHAQMLRGPGMHTVVTKPASGSSVTIVLDKTFSVPGDHRELGAILTEVGFR